MARKDAASKLTLKVITGVGADGKTIYKNHGLSQIVRTDTAVLAD